MQLSVVAWMSSCTAHWHAKVFVHQDGHACFSESADEVFDVADISSSEQRQDGVTGRHHSAGC